MGIVEELVEIWPNEVCDTLEDELLKSLEYYDYQIEDIYS